MADVRMIVYEALLEAEKGELSPGVIGKAMLDKYTYLDKQSRSFMHFMYEGVIDKKITLDYVIDKVSKVPVKKMKKPVRCIIRMGAFQILFMDSVPDRAACNEAVLLAKKKHLNNLTGFINGVLRSVSRLEGNIEYPDKTVNPDKYLSVFYSIPELIINSLKDDYGESKCEEIVDGLLRERPVIGRTIISRIKTDELLMRLNDTDKVKVKRIDDMDAFEFEEMDSLSDIPEFNEGYFTIQDVSSQLVGSISGIRKNDSVLDVCASPGGKSIHAADILLNLGSTKGGVTACDVSEGKIEKILENAQRVHFENLNVQIWDGTLLDDGKIGKFDVVICDAPCSGLGIIGRKRDIKYSLTKEGFKDLALLQKKIISNSVKYLKPGGTFIFSTCTMRKDENDKNYSYIKEELGLLPCDFYNELPKQYQKDSAKEGFLQIFAGEGNADGFYISKFHTRA